VFDAGEDRGGGDGGVAPSTAVNVAGKVRAENEKGTALGCLHQKIAIFIVLFMANGMIHTQILKLMRTVTKVFLDDNTGNIHFESTQDRGSFENQLILRTGSCDTHYPSMSCNLTGMICQAFNTLLLKRDCNTSQT
jgi:hypothetical protein